jgi:hypothetical protein
VPFLLLAFLFVFIILLGIVLMPLSLVQRYRVGTARRPARRWVATLNLAALAFSSAIFLGGAAITTIWLPRALPHAAMGLAAGCVLGVLGLALTRWEITPGSIHYTPNRWLVLGITLVVTARVLYGFWRSWDVWRSGLYSGSLLAASGATGALAAGAVVLGYYLVFWAGVRRRIVRHEGSIPLARVRRW